MKSVFILGALIAMTLAASGKDVKGKVTYVAAGTIYTSLGSEAGVKDSSDIFVVRGQDTVAVLRVIAVSSKSSSALIVKARAIISVGDMVISAVEERNQRAAVAAADSTSRFILTSLDSATNRALKPAVIPSIVSVQGRISAQYMTTVFEAPAANITQPALILNLKAAARDIPLSFEMYGNYRTLTYGRGGLFSVGSVDQSRLYRLSLQYNDGVNATMVGRFVPIAAPAIGYLDGVLFSRTFGELLVGTAAGYQSRSSLNGLNTAYKKVSLFAKYQTAGSSSLFASAAYTRNYFHFDLDRELVSTLVSVSTVNGLGFYFNGDLDLRQKEGGELVLSPSLTNLHASVNYPFARFLSVSLGADLARSYADYSFIRNVPDSLLDRTARSGVSVGFNVSALQGITLSNIFTPRSSDEGFGKEYANVSSLIFSNVFASGVLLRANVNFTANQYSSTRGMGMSVEKSVFDVLQFSVSYQRSRYTVTSLEETNDNTSYVVDALWFVTRDITLSADYNRFDGFGRVSTTIFGELSYRF